MQYRLLLALAPVALAAVHTVDVGKSGFTFEPATVQAAVGDKVIFTLHPSHNVAQAGSFDEPCKNNGGFFSGSFANSKNGDLRFVLTVNSTDPIYYYCAVASHCQSGMVGGINLPSTGNNQQALANKAKGNSPSTVPSGLSGGVLVTEQEAQAIINGGSASSGSPSATTPAATKGSSTPTGSGSATAASNKPTGAANSLDRGTSAGLALVGAIAAWFL